MEIPTYLITIDDFDESGIDRISLVADPAIMVKGLAFNKDHNHNHNYSDYSPVPPVHPNCKCTLDADGWVYSHEEGSPCEICKDMESKYNAFSKYKFSKDRQVVAGPAMIPNVPIYRFDPEMGEYYVVFTPEVIAKLVGKFKKNNRNTSINLDHTNTMVNGYLLSDWIIENKEFDKSRMYGFNELPIGTYFIELKIEDTKFWEDEVKSKEKFGFSIEGFLGLELKLNNQIIKNEKMEETKLAVPVDEVIVPTDVVTEDVVSDDVQAQLEEMKTQISELASKVMELETKLVTEDVVTEDEDMKAELEAIKTKLSSIITTPTPSVTEIVEEIKLSKKEKFHLALENLRKVSE